MTDAELITQVRNFLGDCNRVALIALARRLADALDRHQGERAEAGWLEEIRDKAQHPQWCCNRPQTLALLSHITHLNNLLADAGRSGEYLLGHQAARREIAEKLERMADERRTAALDVLAGRLDDVADLVHSLPDPGEPPPWETLVAENARMRDALRRIARAVANTSPTTLGDLVQIARTALEGGTQ